VDEVAELYYLTFIFEIGSVISILLLVYSIYLIENIKKLFPGGSIAKKWLIMEVLVIGLIALLIFGLIYLLFPDEAMSYIMSGILYIITGIFVFIIVRMNLKTYKIILRKTD
jgi:hypothetical protein